MGKDHCQYSKPSLSTIYSRPSVAVTTSIGDLKVVSSKVVKFLMKEEVVKIVLYGRITLSEKTFEVFCC